MVSKFRRLISENEMVEGSRTIVIQFICNDSPLFNSFNDDFQKLFKHFLILRWNSLEILPDFSEAIFLFTLI